MNDCEEKGRENEENEENGEKEEKEDVLVDERGEEGRGIIKKKKAGAFDTGVFLQDTDNGAWAQLCIYICA